MSFIVTAVVAVEGAIAVTTVATVLTAVAAVGTAMTVVGAVTGNKNLMKIGGTLSIVGGVGSLVNGAIGAAAGEGVAGVAEGAAEGAYSDVAGEKFAQSVGQDAAGSMFGDAATQTFAVGAPGAAANVADSGGILGKAMNSPSLTSGAAQPASALVDASQTGIGSTSMPDLAPKLGAPNGAPSMAGSDLATDANGMYTGQPTSIADAVSPATGVADIADLPQTYGTDPTTFQTIKAKIGKAWDSMSPQMKAEAFKSALAIPGGIQQQKNVDRQLDLAEQRTKQTSYGSQVPVYGIINKAQKG